MNKTSFPKVQDKGEASASVVFSAQIKFSLFPDEDGSVEVKDVACGFKITWGEPCARPRSPPTRAGSRINLSA